ncbi:MAG: exodeoxyribonuclease VII small subunit [Chlamydiae bacterium]|jgi:exodeoxyribonuclease VII small subunit|nr:exodeoxyribonuclease VII small subunit [Chlamydiota bacterium]
MSKTYSFEEAYAKLEEILEKMSKSDVSLDKALSYYEDADKLLALCSQKLEEAEKKIQILTKNRDGSIVVDADNRPLTKDFQPNLDGVLMRDENLN